MLAEIKKQLAEKEEVYLSVKVIPGSSKSELRDKLENDVYKIAIAAVPEKGKANLELIKFLAKELEVAKERVKIISGTGERTKLIKINK